MGSGRIRAKAMRKRTRLGKMWWDFPRRRCRGPSVGAPGAFPQENFARDRRQGASDRCSAERSIVRHSYDLTPCAETACHGG